MLEQQRIDYLKAMGIQLWMPRAVLPHALEPRWLSTDEPDPQRRSKAGQLAGGHASALLTGAAIAEQLSSENPRSQVPSSAQGAAPAPMSSSQSSTSHGICEVQPSPVPKALNPAAAESAAQSTPLSAAESVPQGALQNNIQAAGAPNFELHFYLWPCGLLWVSSQVLTHQDLSFQAAVSFALSSLLTNGEQTRRHVQPIQSHFKWPYLLNSAEDQSEIVAKQALAAQWQYLQSQGVRAWLALDASCEQWLPAQHSPLMKFSSPHQCYPLEQKRALWQALQTLSNPLLKPLLNPSAETNA